MINKNDVIEIDYTGKIIEEDSVFDTTLLDVAKENDLYNDQNKEQFKPLIVCIGQGQIIEGLENAIMQKSVGDEFETEIEPELAFGKKDPKLLSLIPISKFKKENINPSPGLHVNIDDSYGIVKSVSGGRVIVDFNHPLSGKNLKYKVKILKKIEENDIKLKLLVKSLFNLDSEVKLEDNKALITIKLPENFPKEAFNEQVKQEISNKLKELTSIEISVNI
jgi:FKBP-type peptidyl-prolyl cis-trans isomerase 2